MFLRRQGNAKRTGREVGVVRRLAGVSAGGQLRRRRAAAARAGERGLPLSRGARSSPRTTRGTQVLRSCRCTRSQPAWLESIGLDTPLHPDFGTVWNRRAERHPLCRRAPEPAEGVDGLSDRADESDPGPYPIPDHAQIEGGAQSPGRCPRAGAGRGRMQAVRDVELP